MAKSNLHQPLTSVKARDTEAAPVNATAKPKAVTTEAPKVRLIQKVGEVNISAYFPSEVKASLRIAQAQTGNNVKGCLAEALRDFFRKHKGPTSVELGEGR